MSFPAIIVLSAGMAIVAFASAALAGAGSFWAIAGADAKAAASRKQVTFRIVKLPFSRRYSTEAG